MTGVILTGGKSSRMGQDKAFMSVGGLPLFRRILEVFETMFDEILIVTNKEGRHAGLGYREVIDIIPDCGPLGGIYTGLSYAKSERIFVASCDLPFIKASTVKVVIDEPVSYDIVVPDDGGRLHPLHAVYGRKCSTYIRKWLDNRFYNVTKFINEVEDLSVRKVQMSEMTAGDRDLKSFFNMNTQEDWAEADKIAAGDDENPLPQGEGKLRCKVFPPPLTGGGEACPELVEGGEGEQGFSSEPSCPSGAQRGMKISGTRMSRLSTIDGVFQPRLWGFSDEKEE